jgi:hypothetical protein
MRNLLPFLACLMMVFTGWSSMAHAAETVVCAEASQMDTIMHAADDCAEVPADADKGYPHHHATCHGHHVAAPAQSNIAVTLTDRRAEFASDKARLWLAHQSDPALRPPQA